MGHCFPSRALCAKGPRVSFGTLGSDPTGPDPFHSAGCEIGEEFSPGSWKHRGDARECCCIPAGAGEWICPSPSQILINIINAALGGVILTDSMWGWGDEMLDGCRGLLFFLENLLCSGHCWAGGVNPVGLGSVGITLRRGIN